MLQQRKLNIETGHKAEKKTRSDDRNESRVSISFIYGSEKQWMAFEKIQFQSLVLCDTNSFRIN